MGKLHDQEMIWRFRRGLAANINATATKNQAVEGEPHWATDTDQLYIFDGVQNLQVLTLDSNGQYSFAPLVIANDLLFTGEDTGLQFAQIYEEDGVGTLALAAQDTQYQVVSFSVDGEKNVATPDHANDHITIAAAGKYLAFIDISFFQTTAVSIEYDFHIKINDGATDMPQVSAHRNSGAVSAVGNCGSDGILDLAVNDTVELWVERLDGGAVSRTITFRALSLTLVQIGGT